MPTPILELEQVSLRYGSTTALQDVDLQVPAGEFLCLRGPSGSGKTSLLLIAGGMLRPSTGRVRLAGHDLYAMPPNQRSARRGADVGFVFQTFHLVPYLDIVDNVRLAGGGRLRKTRDEAIALLDRMGLAHRTTHKPMALSVGERQRAALARALFPGPALLLADEPTGNLDPDNAETVLELLSEFHRGGGTVVLVTHGTGSDHRADRVLQLRSGALQSAAPVDAE